ncbi:MAG: 50S ribosomal protein L13 [Candidatus Taylorbacteria bacterium RIFOXYD2_FULL_36_9]|uniref:50S ribosomal protein L13 n=1 Tax=Candidatus Taylorbacteria bacterium RIFOXYD2_FULL_36_9 TaxID=1802338 RepID=A0A1G2PFY8_9BACT|nr:MAG: 50S ribosomal protein L13 [Candidatus Taylorbacteria bacterium RIFOXYD2_FULL_36_9]
MKEYKIDASGKKLGRVASEIASILIGKQDANFQKNEVAEVKVEVINSAKMDITEKKTRTKVYGDYSGFPGGLRKKTLGEMAVKNGYAAVLERAVSGMIHNNKLKTQTLKNLTIKE